MNALDAAVNAIATQVADTKERQHYIGLLESMAKDCKAAADVWGRYLANPGAQPKNPNSVMDWTGAAVAKKLFELQLSYRAKMLAVTKNHGDLEDPVIELAYRRVNEGETGPTVAQAAIERMKNAAATIQALADKVRNTAPKKSAAKPAAKKNPAKKAAPKAVKKKAAPNIVKKKAAKKAAVKKAAKKAPKKAVSKKPAKKKAKKR